MRVQKPFGLNKQSRTQARCRVVKIFSKWLDLFQLLIKAVKITPNVSIFKSVSSILRRFLFYFNHASVRFDGNFLKNLLAQPAETYCLQVEERLRGQEPGDNVERSGQLASVDSGSAGSDLKDKTTMFDTMTTKFRC